MNCVPQNLKPGDKLVRKSYRPGLSNINEVKCGMEVTFVRYDNYKTDPGWVVNFQDREISVYNSRDQFERVQDPCVEQKKPAKPPITRVTLEDGRLLFIEEPFDAVYKKFQMARNGNFADKLAVFVLKGGKRRISINASRVATIVEADGHGDQ